MRIVFYGNGGCGNHGCEAIYRGTAALLGESKNSYMILSTATNEDKKYGLEKLAAIEEAKTSFKRDYKFMQAYVKMKLMHDYSYMDVLPYQLSIQKIAADMDIAFSVGGDNYCYGNEKFYYILNEQYRRNGLKTVLLGCSIEPDVVKNKAAANDLSKFDLIVARESITYNVLSNINDNTILSPDPAFFMLPEKCGLHRLFTDKKIVGINLSPMIIANEKCTGLAYDNYKHLVKYILAETDYSIALIPHVVWDTNDDRKVLRKLYEDIGESDRVFLVEDHNAPELKYIISKCTLFIGARTHSTIAAYSTCVPTLVVGYSVKARGIAKDLFGQEENYVIQVQSLDSPRILTESFKWLNSNQEKIRLHLEEIMPEYIARGYKAKDKIMELI